MLYCKKNYILSGGTKVKHRRILCMMMALCMMLSVVMINPKVEAQGTPSVFEFFKLTIGGTKNPVLESFTSYQLEGWVYSNKQLKTLYMVMERKDSTGYKRILTPRTYDLRGLRTCSYNFSAMTNFKRDFKIENLTPGEYRLYVGVSNVDGVGIAKYLYFSIGFDERTFVHELYRCVLDREPDVEGFNNNLYALTSGRVNARGLARAFVQSPEFKSRNFNNDQYIRQLYKGLLGRYPDTGGYNSWMWWLTRGDGDYRDFVLEQFLNSPEFENRCRNFGVNY